MLYDDFVKAEAHAARWKRRALMFRRARIDEIAIGIRGRLAGAVAVFNKQELDALRAERDTLRSQALVLTYQRDYAESCVRALREEILRIQHGGLKKDDGRAG